MQAPRRTCPPACYHEESSQTRLRPSSAPARRASKLISTMTSVPPAICTAAGNSALAAIASASDLGCRNSIALPGLPRWRRVIAGDRALDEPVRAVRGEEHLAVVLQAE